MFTVQTILLSLEFVIHKTLEHDIWIIQFFFVFE